MKGENLLMRPGRILLGAIFVIDFFFSFLFGGFLFEAFYGSSFGVSLVASNNQIAGMFLEFAVSVILVLASLLISWKRYGRDLWQLCLLGSVSLLSIISLVIMSGMSFPVFTSRFFGLYIVMFVASIAGIVYGARGMLASNARGMAANFSPASIPVRRDSALIWSTVIASTAGLFGLVSLDYTPFQGFMEVPAPFLGQPFGYQSLGACSLAVCPPLVRNNIVIAGFDFIFCFAIAFFAAFWAQRVFKSVTSNAHSIFKRNILPLILLAITLMLVLSSAYSSVASGSSLQEPHWPTPSGATFYLGTVSLFSGSATTSSGSGAHIDLNVSNYHWTKQTITVQYVHLQSSSNGTTIYPAIYQCESPNACNQNSTFVVPPYSALTLSVYLNSPIEKGIEYSYNLNITSSIGESVTAFNNISAS